MGGSTRLAAKAVLVIGLVIAGRGLGSGPPQPDASAEGANGVYWYADQDRPAPPMPAALPLRVRIPSIGVDAPLTALSLDRTGHLVPPPESRTNLAGWYADGTVPGAAGPAIIAGHVDNGHGPAVFYGLGALSRGDTVDVVRADRRTAVFLVDSVQVFAKDKFPDKDVYGPTSVAALRLITCGGGYQAGKGYLGNVVVFAHLVSRPPG
ncbi:class F sortase [Streptacidiphilus neutrinimicus]|uniref:class F sortase n=1 Tax=Streptacidiphilus neutrinimicus TaxID=105420 RepID=UPI000693DE5A|nr:class F sortase [Streptacidiphilus neutrinimicus]